MSGQHRPLVIGHRGASIALPENTLAAFQLAMMSGADGIEFDVRLSRDQIPVVIHDATLKRTGKLDGAISDLTAAELQGVDVGVYFEGRRKPLEVHPIPSLAEVFDLFAKTGFMYLEMKGEPVQETLIELVAAMINERAMYDRVIVECFDHTAIRRLNTVDARVKTAALFESKLQRMANWSSKNVLRSAVEAKADEIALHHSLVNEKLVRAAEKEGFEIVVWTVDNPRWIERAQKLGIKAVITNDPATMVCRRQTPQV